MDKLRQKLYREDLAGIFFYYLHRFNLSPGGDFCEGFAGNLASDPMLAHFHNLVTTLALESNKSPNDADFLAGRSFVLRDLRFENRMMLMSGDTLDYVMFFYVNLTNHHINMFDDSIKLRNQYAHLSLVFKFCVFIVQQGHVCLQEHHTLPASSPLPSPPFV